MYAIIRTGGKQYTVRVGDVLRVEKLPKELGSEFELEEVLLVGGEKVHIGEPTVPNAKVTVVVTRQAKAPKVIVFKKKRRQGYRRLHGHRQFFTELFIKSIKSPSGETSQAEAQAVVVDPAKKEARIKAFNEAKKEEKKTGAKRERLAKKASATKKKASPKKKAAKKKTAAKAKKKTAAKKKAVKKKATKKASK